MKRIIAALAVAVVSTPLFATEPTLETQKHDSSLMMDGMKSLNSKVEATWVSKEQTESVAKESASILKEMETEIAPAVKRAKADLAAGQLKSQVPGLSAQDKHSGSKLKEGLLARWKCLKGLVALPIDVAQGCYQLYEMNRSFLNGVSCVLIYPPLLIVSAVGQLYQLIIGGEPIY